jgi:hypothetical protein
VNLHAPQPSQFEARNAPTALVSVASGSKQPAKKTNRGIVALIAASPILVVVGIGLITVVVLVAGYAIVSSKPSNVAAPPPKVVVTPPATATPAPPAVPPPTPPRKVTEGDVLRPDDRLTMKVLGGYWTPTFMRAGVSYAFPKGRTEALCVLVLRTGEQCCATEAAGPCRISVQPSDLLTGGQGLSVWVKNESGNCTYNPIRWNDTTIVYRIRGYKMATNAIRTGMCQEMFGTHGDLEEISFFLEPK